MIGASGYGGLQVLRLLQGHPHLRVTFLGGERSSGRRWRELVPFLPLEGDPIVRDPDPAAIAAEEFLILPHPEVLTYLQRKTADYGRWLGGMRKLQARITGGA